MKRTIIAGRRVNRSAHYLLIRHLAGTAEQRGDKRADFTGYSAMIGRK
jgi:hypothetical protein